MNACPGAAVGKAVFDSHRAAELAAKGEEVILVRRETNPDDLHGMIAAQGILTSRGGKTATPPSSPAAWARPASAAPRSSRSTCAGRKFTAPGGVVVSEGDVISIDGTTGAVYLGEVPVQSVARSCSTSRASLDADSDAAGRGRAPAHRRTPTRSAGSACGPTPTPPRTPSGPAGSARRASACAAPSTCSSASGASSSRT